MELLTVTVTAIFVRGGEQKSFMSWRSDHELKYDVQTGQEFLFLVVVFCFSGRTSFSVPGGRRNEVRGLIFFWGERKKLESKICRVE